jgi:hypothetical protein
MERRTRRLRAIALLLAATLPWLQGWAAPVPAAAQGQWQLHARGFGPLTVGMPLGDARALPGVQLEALGPPPVADTWCTYYLGRVDSGEFRVRVMKDLVDRIEVEAPGIRTLSGVAVGDSVERVKRAYADRLTVEPHHSLWGQGYLMMVAGPFRVSGEDYAVTLVGSPQKGVTAIWAGRLESARESEGCQ